MAQPRHPREREMLIGSNHVAREGNHVVHRVAASDCQHVNARTCRPKSSRRFINMAQPSKIIENTGDLLQARESNHVMYLVEGGSVITWLKAGETKVKETIYEHAPSMPRN